MLVPREERGLPGEDILRVGVAQIDLGSPPDGYAALLPLQHLEIIGL